LTDLVVIDAPLWNFTPGCSLKVYVRRSGETVQLSARLPTIFVEAGAYLSRPSYWLRITELPSMS